jgi:hypothetical protein
MRVRVRYVVRTLIGAWMIALGLTSATANADEPGVDRDAASTQIVTPKKIADIPTNPSATRATPAASPAPTGKFGIVPFAMLGYTPETGFIVGAAAIGVYRNPPNSGRRDSQLSVAGAVSLGKLLGLELKPDIYLLDDRVQLGGVVSIARSETRFYGIGSHTKEQDEEDFTQVAFELALSPKLRLFRGMYLGPDVRFTATDTVETEVGGALAQGTIPGSRGGRTVEAGVGGFYDTRDETIYPLTGHVVRLFARRALPALGSQFAYDVLSIDARKYVTLPWGHRHVLALQALAEIRDGTPPFYELGLMGGDQTMRGYYRGRFRDRNYLAAQVEYRMPLFWRFGAVAFAGAGQTSHTLSEARVSPVRFAGGGGLRFAPVQNIPVNVRVDVAYGNEPLFYLGLAEAF